MAELADVAPEVLAAAQRVLSQFAEGLRVGLPPAVAARGVGASCLLVAGDDMESRAARFNWAHPMPLPIDGHAYRRRQLARRRRKH